MHTHTCIHVTCIICVHVYIHTCIHVLVSTYMQCTCLYRVCMSTCDMHTHVCIMYACLHVTYIQTCMMHGMYTIYHVHNHVIQHWHEPRSLFFPGSLQTRCRVREARTLAGSHCCLPPLSPYGGHRSVCAQGSLPGTSVCVLLAL